ncbi:MAG: 50S ribosome-binding GTPase [Methanobrevibacter sp.]|nr:50S ribosome-binding GTPase [Methanobrevibacter sp.]
MSENKESKKEFPLERMLRIFLTKTGKVSKEEIGVALDKLRDELRNKPFRVAIIGQGGVGKTSTIQSVFGVKPGKSNKIRTVEEGTCDIEEKLYDIEDGFTLSIADMPGLKNDITKDVNVYIPLYKRVLPDCDLIIYIIDAHAKELGIDIQILRDIVMPICKNTGKTNNIIIALNKIDAIGQSFPEYRTDKEYHWDRINNKPTQTLTKLIEERLMTIYKTLVREKILGDIKIDQSPAYSAVYAYNMQGLLLAILESDNGYKFVGTVAQDVMAKWSDKKEKL